MLLSLKEATQEPKATKDAIRLALKSPVGLRLTWVIVEAEDDVQLYSKFVNGASSIVKNSANSKGIMGYSHVEIIVKELKAEVPSMHILGIRDIDYAKYEKGFAPAENIFLTDCRDLEMMLLKTDSVRQELDQWMHGRYEEIYGKCVQICRYFGYLRICNGILKLLCDFKEKLKITRFWDFKCHDLIQNWRQQCTSRFLALVKNNYSSTSLQLFIDGYSLENEDFFDVCRGHDYLPLMSLMLKYKEYSGANIMQKMIKAYNLGDFKNTRLYAALLQWQQREGVEVFLA